MATADLFFFFSFSHQKSDVTPEDTRGNGACVKRQSKSASGRTKNEKISRGFYQQMDAADSLHILSVRDAQTARGCVISNWGL